MDDVEIIIVEVLAALVVVLALLARRLSVSLKGRTLRVQGPGLGRAQSTQTDQ